MSLYKDLLAYKRKSLYKVARTRKDARLNVGADYQEVGLLQRMLSKHIQRNQTLSEFISFLNDYLLNILKGLFLLIYDFFLFQGFYQAPPMKPLLF